MAEPKYGFEEQQARETARALTAWERRDDQDSTGSDARPKDPVVQLLRVTAEEADGVWPAVVIIWHDESDADAPNTWADADAADLYAPDAQHLVVGQVYQARLVGESVHAGTPLYATVPLPSPAVEESDGSNSVDPCNFLWFDWGAGAVSDRQFAVSQPAEGTALVDLLAGTAVVSAVTMFCTTYDSTIVSGTPVLTSITVERRAVPLMPSFLPSEPSCADNQEDCCA